MELILDKNKKKEHTVRLPLRVNWGGVPLLQGTDHGEKAPARKQDALPPKMFTGTEAEPHYH